MAHQLHNAKVLKHLVGVAAAARYLRKCGWPCSVTLAYLVHSQASNG